MTTQWIMASDDNEWHFAAIEDDGKTIAYKAHTPEDIFAYLRARRGYSVEQAREIVKAGATRRVVS